jgi:molybdopterin synthase sulfur carrier subunit
VLGAAVATVDLDGMLREFVPRRHLETTAPTLGAMLEELEGKYPRLRGKLRDETGTLRPFVKLFRNGTEVGRAGWEAEPLGTSDVVDVLHSIQGG